MQRNQRMYGCNFQAEQTPEIAASCKEGYTNHNERVRQGVPPERLLVYNVKQGWGPLCKFLGVPVPNKPFPKKDVTKAKDAFSKFEKAKTSLLVGFVALF